MEKYWLQYEPWKIEKLLGEGAYGKVYEITREDFGHTYRAALKVITVPSENEILELQQKGTSEQEIDQYCEELVKRFASEIEQLYSLHRTFNIIGYEDHKIVKNTNGYGYTIMLRTELSENILVNGKVKNNESEVIKMGIDISGSLEKIHLYNRTHKDVREENIFVSENGYKLGGLVDTDNISVMGTSFYLPLEVYNGETTYGWSADIYALGIVMYKLMNDGKLPFLLPGKNISLKDREIAIQKMYRETEKIPPRYASEKLSRIILKACHLNQDKRYQSAKEMKEDLLVLQEELQSGKNDYLLLPYNGDKPYIFVSYSHKDVDEAIKIIRKLQSEGYRIWYDEGIVPGSEWDENIALHVNRCELFIALLSDDYIKSSNCKDELNHARNKEKNRLLVYLSDISLPEGMEMRLSRIQNIRKYAYRSEKGFYRKLYMSKGISCCREEDTVALFDQEESTVPDKYSKNRVDKTERNTPKLKTIIRKILRHDI